MGGKGPGVCYFCRRIGSMSKEHAWPQWMHADAGPVAPERWTSTSGFTRTEEDALTEIPLREMRRQGSPLTIKVRQVCRECNNGWMNALEQKVRPTIDHLCQGAYPFGRTAVALPAAGVARGLALATGTDEDPTHVLLALLYDPSDQAASVWRLVGVDPAQVRDHLAGTGVETPPAPLPVPRTQAERRTITFGAADRPSVLRAMFHAYPPGSTLGWGWNIEAATDAPPDTSKAVPKPFTPMRDEGVEQPGTAGLNGGPVPAAGAAPKPAPPEQLNLEAGKARGTPRARRTRPRPAG
jgi:hypothetical protein